MKVRNVTLIISQDTKPSDMITNFKPSNDDTVILKFSAGVHYLNFIMYSCSAGINHIEIRPVLNANVTLRPEDTTSNIIHLGDLQSLKIWNGDDGGELNFIMDNFQSLPFLTGSIHLDNIDDVIFKPKLVYLSNMQGQQYVDVLFLNKCGNVEVANTYFNVLDSSIFRVLSILYATGDVYVYNNCIYNIRGVPNQVPSFNVWISDTDIARNTKCLFSHNSIMSTLVGDDVENAERRDAILYNPRNTLQYGAEVEISNNLVMGNYDKLISIENDTNTHYSYLFTNNYYEDVLQFEDFLAPMKNGEFQMDITYEGLNTQIDSIPIAKIDTEDQYPLGSHFLPLEQFSSEVLKDEKLRTDFFGNLRSTDDNTAGAIEYSGECSDGYWDEYCFKCVVDGLNENCQCKESHLLDPKENCQVCKDVNKDPSMLCTTCIDPTFSYDSNCNGCIGTKCKNKDSNEEYCAITPNECCLNNGEIMDSGYGSCGLFNSTDLKFATFQNSVLIVVVILISIFACLIIVILIALNITFIVSRKIAKKKNLNESKIELKEGSTNGKMEKIIKRLKKKNKKLKKLKKKNKELVEKLGKFKKKEEEEEEESKEDDTDGEENQKHLNIEENEEDEESSEEETNSEETEDSDESSDSEAKEFVYY